MTEMAAGDGGMNDVEKYLGGSVLIGLTFCDADGANPEQVQKWGFIRSASPDRGIEIELSGQDKGERFWLPPTFEGFIEAEGGRYALKNGDVVDDPDFLATYTITRAMN